MSARGRRSWERMRRPQDAAALRGGDDYDEDLSDGKGVWLLGEQRWARY